MDVLLGMTLDIQCQLHFSFFANGRSLSLSHRRIVTAPFHLIIWIVDHLSMGTVFKLPGSSEVLARVKAARCCLCLLPAHQFHERDEGQSHGNLLIVAILETHAIEGPIQNETPALYAFKDPALTKDYVQ